MMTEPVDNTTAAEERQNRIREETSFGKYAGQQFLQYATLAVGAVAGFFAFKGLKSVGAMKPIENAIQKRVKQPQLAEEAVKKARKIADYVGAGVGALLGRIINAYGNWKKVESENLAVQEVNSDVANLMQERGKFADTLTRQEGFIRDLIAQRKDKDSQEPATGPAQTR
jgi:hypothetical protein